MDGVMDFPGRGRRFNQSLWDITPGQISDLERNWILPRSPWSTRDTFLKHTCAARHWGEWVLRYAREGADIPPTQNATSDRALRDRLRTRLRRMPLVRDLAPRDSVIAIIDLCDLRQRVAVFRSGSRRPWRLARELGAQFAYLSESYQLTQLQEGNY